MQSNNEAIFMLGS